MRTSFLIAIVVCSLCVFSAMAQDNSSSQSAQQPSYNQSTTTTTTTQSSSTNSQATDNAGQSSSTMPSGTQSAMSNGATQTSNDGSQTVEGCLIHEQTGYYVQPENGGARVQLSPSRSLDSYVGQHVSLTGRSGATEDNSSTAASSGGTSDLGSGMLTVTSVKTISARCSPARGPSR